MSSSQPDHVLVQHATLEKLRCFLCRNYLSVLPIYVNSAGNPICGRCPIVDKNDVRRNTLYENVVEFQKFPCANRDTGCLETGIPSEMAKHEEQCTFKKRKCPTSAYNDSCTWEGMLIEILDHFETDHPTLILKELRSFELDLVNSHKESYLLPYENDLYEVTRESDSDSGIFAITIRPLDLADQTINGTYELTLESGSKGYKCVMQELLGNTLKLNRSSINQILNGPLTIVARITINKDSKALVSLKSAYGAETDGRGRINYDELKKVECPVCLHYIVTPIYQCATGHNICKKCMETQQSCPTCRSAFNGTRNFGLEDVMMERTFPCRYQGCKFTFLGKHIGQHETRCLYGPVDCPLKEHSKCDYTVAGFKLFDHIRHIHSEQLLDDDTISVPFQGAVAEDIVETYITRRYERLFKICFRYDRENEKFLWELQMVNPDEQELKYYFELEVIDETGNDSKLYVRGNCAPMVGIDQTFSNEGYYIMFYRSQLARFINEKLTYRILIKEKV